jgi:transcriptional regulator with XRE-family HTH domain
MIRGPQASLHGPPIDELLAVAKARLGVETMKLVHERSGIAPSAASKIRHGKLLPTAEIILRLHDVTGLSINDIREKLGVRKYAHINAQQAGDQQPAQN